MSPDEGFATLASIVVALAAWGRWYWTLARPTRLASSHADRYVLYAAPPVCLGLLWIVLRLWADAAVRQAPPYLLMYTAMGMAWLGAAKGVIPLLGLSARDDVVERRNGAAGTAIAGALVAITFCFAGGNIGDGPGWWVVVFCAALATAGLALLWALVDFASGLADAITVDRDSASGVRLAGWLIALGMILGRAVAGDWHSFEGTLRDFVLLAWPALLLAAVEAAAGLLSRPRPSQPAPSVWLVGVPPALLYVAIATLYLWWKGPWDAIAAVER